MTSIAPPLIARLADAPPTLTEEGVLRVEVQEGIPVLRATASIEGRIEELLARQHDSGLSAEEEAELDRFEEIDDYLSLFNRVVRNALEGQATGD